MSTTSGGPIGSGDLSPNTLPPLLGYGPFNHGGSLGGVKGVLHAGDRGSL